MDMNTHGQSRSFTRGGAAVMGLPSPYCLTVELLSTKGPGAIAPGDSFPSQLGT